jgi:hypothetical protein
MQDVCDGLDGKTWFRIETEGEAALESDLMGHAVENYFRQAREHAAASYAHQLGCTLSRTPACKRTCSA